MSDVGEILTLMKWFGHSFITRPGGELVLPTWEWVSSPPGALISVGDLPQGHGQPAAQSSP